MTSYHRWWFGLIALAICIEGIALARTGSGDTMSEWVWSKIAAWPLRTTVGALLVWLLWHFLFSGPARGMTKWDAVFALLGAAIGLAAFRWGWR